jgi:hydrogenase maturation protease
MTPRILIAGIGNIFLGDDAFGVEVVRRLAERPLPEGVRVVDFGIRGLDLTYALLDGCDTAILVDAAPRGYTPGTLFVLEPSIEEAANNEKEPIAPSELLIETHGMDPVRVLRLVRAMGGKVRKILVVGCEPTPLASEEDMEIGLSDPVQCAVIEAVPMIESLIAKILEEKESAVSVNV